MCQPDNAVRAIDVWVRTLDLQQLGFGNTDASAGVGQPAYDPAVLLKLYLHGCQRGIRSSRKLEYSTPDSLEVMWSCQEAHPCYKTIANFRKDNAEALKAAQKEFLLVCRQLSLLGGEQVAVDGSFLKADASRDSMYTAAKLEKKLEKLEEKIAAYHRQLDEADQQEAANGKSV